MITLEANAEYAEVARGSIERAGLGEVATRAQRRLHEDLAAEPRITATTIQTVGGKGYDGFTVGLVL